MSASLQPCLGAGAFGKALETPAQSLPAQSPGPGCQSPVRGRFGKGLTSACLQELHSISLPSAPEGHKSPRGASRCLHTSLSPPRHMYFPKLRTPQEWVSFRAPPRLILPFPSKTHKEPHSSRARTPTTSRQQSPGYAEGEEKNTFTPF